jgi:hypothetical protein
MKVILIPVAGNTGDAVACDDIIIFYGVGRLYNAPVTVLSHPV